MTVGELIKELQKYPKKLTVYTSDFDHGEHEVHGIVNWTQLIDKDEIEEDGEDIDNAQGNWEELPRKYVTLRH